MRASGLESRLTRAPSLTDKEDQRRGLPEHNRRIRLGLGWMERWKIGRMNSSSLSDPRSFKQAYTKLYLLLMLGFAALTLTFTPNMFGLFSHSQPEQPAAVTHRVSNRARQKPNPCSIKLPDILEDLKIPEEERRGLGTVETPRYDSTLSKKLEQKGDGQPQGASLLEGIRLGKRPSIGLLNIDKDEAFRWQDFAHGRMPVYFPFAMVNETLQWSDFYPEWIDEEELNETPECPHLPMPCVRKGVKLDLVVARVPCRASLQSEGGHDIKRLQLLLSAASIASQTGHKAMNVLILSDCRPLVNLFPCGELLEHHNHFWLYDVNLVKMRKRLALPVGSCELSLSLNHPGQLMTSKVNERRQAYVSMVHTDPAYACGAIVLAHSIRLSGSTRDLVMLVDANILPEQRQGLEAAGWKVREIERIRNPYAQKDRYNEWNYSKFRLWQLTEYDKIVFIDSDLLVLRNIDFLFDLPEISATGNDENRFNSGVMVVEPSNCTFNLLLDQIMVTKSYNGGDQGYLNEIFPWWHRLPKHVNFLKHFWSNKTEEFETKTQLFAADKPILYVIHYLGMKPWLCYRDYDCNWNIEGQDKYASDAAHATWFRIHDSMPETLQKHCWIKTLFKAAREVERRQAEAANYKDEHWKIKIKDPRLQYCPTPGHCDWQEMILHWDGPLSNNTIPLTT